MAKLIWVMLGASLGAVMRYIISLALYKWLNVFPWATLLVNLIGSFIIGLVLFGSLFGKDINESYRLLVVVGFCGSFTTFSTFAFESFAMLETNYIKFAGNVLLNVVGTLLMIAIAKWISIKLAV